MPNNEARRALIFQGAQVEDREEHGNELLAHSLLNCQMWNQHLPVLAFAKRILVEPALAMIRRTNNE